MQTLMLTANAFHGLSVPGFERFFFDASVFNPGAPSNHLAYHRNEREKRHQYEHHVRDHEVELLLQLEE